MIHIFFKATTTKNEEQENQETLLDRTNYIPCPHGCKFAFSTKLNFALHRWRKHDVHIVNCQKCDSEFEELADYNQHLKHSDCGEDNKEYECNKCQLKWKSWDALALHLGLDHDIDRPAVCESCGMILHSQKYLKRHKCKHQVQEHSEDNESDSDYELPEPKAKKIKVKRDEFLCSPCKRTFSSKQFYELHVKSVHELSDIVCSKCPEIKFETVEKLNQHLLESCKEDDKEYKCNKCSLKWNSIHVLRLHLQHDHDILKPSVCDQCGLILSAQKHLARHKKYVHLGVKHMCDVCGKSYNSEAGLREHIEKKHEGNHGTNCEKCKLDCGSVQELFKHCQECCNEGKAFDCNKCESKWNSAANLKLHLEIEHGVEKPAVCDICGHILSAAKHLSRHMKYIHSGFRNICHLCGQGFAGIQYLRDHIDGIHDGNYKFMCDLCPFKCVKKRSLDTHINSVHTKSIKYECPHCDFTTFNSGARNNHIRFVHKKVRPHKCDLCTEAYVSGRELSNHKAKKHNIGVYVPQKNYHKKKTPSAQLNTADNDLRRFQHHHNPFGNFHP